MSANPLKQKLGSNTPIIGIWSIVPSPILSEIFGLSGLDFQIFDMEHGIYNLQTLDSSIRSCEGSGCASIVRIPQISQTVVQSVMDLGTDGIIVPQIMTKEDVDSVIQFMRYAPEGVRGYNPFTRAAQYSNPLSNDQGKMNNDYGFSSIIIENATSYALIDDILTVPQLDMVYLGVYDMSIALGCKGNVQDPVILKFVECCVKKIRDAGKAAGMMVRSKEDIQHAYSLGANVLVYGVDSNLIYQSSREAVDHMKDIFYS
ncbi:HpcH/HpaI aldolase family protein [Paenibacillus silagei]|uniref:4-hydroxy-2-oxoheptanedioate aldolase n=1 Tax=Paenibacillus silagei TaxID=1670801 RepID=A0ABS4NNT0_9BACL|nr:aldolase/citrate lyase family protein [Paenibacillus silagei]MBP2111673.1 4-hydroxy-2-oxoheptanedioate aldolase [Paenibacillus silagei]